MNRLARTLKEKVIDQFITGYVINECYNTYNVTFLSETKLQKLVFLSERKLISQRIKALNYSYLAYKRGPFSFEVRHDFEKYKLIENIDDQYINSIDNINKIIADFSDILKRNDEIINRIDRVLKQYAFLDLDELLERVYNLSYKGRKIRYIKLKTPLLFRLYENSSSKIFDITEEELDDLSLCLDPNVAMQLDPALEDMRRGRVLSIEKVSRQL